MLIGGSSHVKSMGLKFKVVHCEHRALRSEFEILPFHLTSSLSSAAAPVSFFRATYGPADECGAHAVDLYSKITRHMAYANILHLRRATKFPTAFPRIIILFVHSYREQIGIMTSTT